MTSSEIDLARAYLAGSAQDPIAALIWAVKDLAHTRRLVPSRHAPMPGPRALKPEPSGRPASAGSETILPGLASLSTAI